MAQLNPGKCVLLTTREREGCWQSRSQREEGLLPVLPHLFRQRRQLLHAAHLARLHQKLADKAQLAPLAHSAHIGVCKRSMAQRGRKV